MTSPAPAVEDIHSAEVDGGDGLIAKILRGPYRGGEGIHFFTDASGPQQVAYINHPAGHEVAPHVHVDRPRTVSRTQEVLVVWRGCVDVYFFTSAGVHVCTRRLLGGDVCLLLGGGHGLRFVDDTNMLEVKVGPYLGKENDKRML